MRIDNEIKLDYYDVLLPPKISTIFEGVWKVGKTFRIGKEKFTDVCQIEYVGDNTALKERLKGNFLNIYSDRLSSNFKLNK